MSSEGKSTVRRPSDEAAASAAREAVALRDAMDESAWQEIRGRRREALATPLPSHSVDPSVWRHICREARTHSPTYEDVRRLQHRIPEESEVAEFLTASEYQAFTDAPIFVTSPQMMDVVAAAAASLTVDDLERGFDFTRSPKSGILLLPRGTRFKTAGGRYEGNVRLLSWGGDIVHNEYADPRGRSVHSIGVELWVPGDARAPLVQGSTQILARAESIPEAGMLLAKVDDADAAEHASGDALPNADGLIGPRLLYAFLRLLEQKTASESPMPTKSKRARRVARQAGVDDP
jgi:hypothetical protein